MATVRTTAVVLRRIPFGETSWIVHALTESDGAMGMMARGARRKGSPLASGVEPLTVSELVVAVKPGRELQNLTQASPLESHPALAKDFERQATALACTEAVVRFVREEGAAPGLFQLLRRTLSDLDAGSPCAPAYWRFLARLADELGWGLALEHCAQCGSEDVSRSRVVSAAAGGFLCPSCARSSHDAPVSELVADVLRGTASPGPGEGSPDESDAIEDILYEHLCRHAGVRPRLDARILLRSARS